MSRNRNRHCVRSNRALGVVIACAALASGLGEVWASGELPAVRIGIVSDGPREREHDFVTRFRREVESAAAGSHAVEFPADATVDGAWSPEGIAAMVDEMLGRPDLDLLVVVGVGAAAEVCNRQELPVPVVVPFALAGCSAACPRQSDLRVRSIDLRDVIARDLRSFSEVYGRLRNPSVEKSPMRHLPAIPSRTDSAIRIRLRAPRTSPLMTLC